MIFLNRELTPYRNRELTPYRNGIGLLSSLKWGKTTRKSFLWWSALAKV